MVRAAFNIARAIYYNKHGKQKLSNYWLRQIEWFRKHYRDYLKTRHWEELNNKLITQNPNAKCFICGRMDTLLIHHVRYDNLFFEKLYRDVYLVCFNGHERIHFRLHDDSKVFIDYPTLVKRMFFLKYTNRVRNFRLGSALNALFTRSMSQKSYCATRQIHH